MFIFNPYISLFSLTLISQYDLVYAHFHSIATLNFASPRFSSLCLVVCPRHRRRRDFLLIYYIEFARTNQQVQVMTNALSGAHYLNNVFFFLDCFGSDNEELNVPKSILIYPVKNINKEKQQK